MKNLLKTDNDFTHDIPKSVSSATNESLQRLSEGSQAALNKAAQAARQLKQTPVVQYLEHNPVKTAVVVVAAGLLIYSIFSRKKRVSQEHSEQR